MNEKAKYWLDLCEDDLLTAKALLQSERLLHMGFFCHLIIEKALKAVIAKSTNDQPPRTHDLQRLAKHSGLFESLSEQQLTLIDRLTPLNIEARYPEHKEKIAASLTTTFCKRLLAETEELLCWIKQMLDS